MIAELIFDWARRTPHKTAVIHNGLAISYAQFADGIAAARGFFAARIQNGPGIALIVDDNLMNCWVFALALRSLGFTTAAPRDDFEGWLTLPDLRAVITTEGAGAADLARLCAARDVGFVQVPQDGNYPESADVKSVPPPGGQILTTSGTTGAYKKLLITPDADRVFLREIAETMRVTQDSVFSVFRFPAWTGVGYKWAASPWLVGGTTLIEQRDHAWQAMFRPGTTHAVMFPALLETALAGIGDRFRPNPALQLFITGGAMTQGQADEARNRITPQLFNVLGSTEAGILAVTRLDAPDDLRWQQLTPGRRIEIVDETGAVSAAGQTGRLRVKIAHGTEGYLLDDAATREFFRDGWFYPGDLGVIRADGRLALQGRVTEVINRRGGKIPAGPIETGLAQRLGVEGVCLFSAQNPGGEEELHVIIATPSAIDTGVLAAGLQPELGGLFRVNVYYLAALPRNPAGKILRDAVRQHALSSRPDLQLTHDAASGVYVVIGPRKPADARA